jgi:hypothetical protein
LLIAIKRGINLLLGGVNLSEIDFNVYYTAGRKIDLKRLVLPDLGGDPDNQGANQGNILFRDKNGQQLIDWENMF